MSILSFSYAQFDDGIIAGSIGEPIDINCKEICAQTCKRVKENVCRPNPDGTSSCVGDICMEWGKDAHCFYDLEKNDEKCLSENKNNLILCSKLEGYYDSSGC